MAQKAERTEGEHSSFYKNTIWQYGLQILKYVFPLILIPYLTRVLGTDGYAVYSYVVAFMGVVQSIADFGFTLSGTKKVTACKDDIASINRLVGNITAARLMLLTVLLIATLVISAFIPIMAANIPYVVLCFIAVGLRAMLPDFLFQGFENMQPLTTRYFIAKGVQIVLVLLFVRSANDLLILGLTDIVSSVLGLAWSFSSAKKLFGAGISKPNVKQSIHELKESAIYCVSNVSSSLFSGFTTIIIGLALDNADIAFWSLALSTVSAVQALYAPISNSLYPHMLNNHDFGFAKKICILAAPALAVGTIAYILLSEPIAVLLGGSDFGGTAHVMIMLSPVLPLSFYAVVLGWPVLGAIDRVKELTLTTVIAGTFNVVSMLLLYVLGWATLDTICIARCFVEAVLLGTRLVALYQAHGKPAAAHGKDA